MECCRYGGAVGERHFRLLLYGGISAIASTAAYSVQLNESCPDGTKTAFGGIATLNASKSGLTVVLASADEARGAAVFFSK